MIVNSHRQRQYWRMSNLIRLRRINDGKVYNVGDTVCEILLKNANDGTSAYELMAGLSVFVASIPW
ncbi:uncharacterized protein DUF932 [Rhizobium azibense]|uniref:Uncharacterized protein DUF932 n=2 Tax=Rhizobium azibense TaxID=1136135 RepID=A0A4R3RAA4_9HYPH|nr:uncharacterized protein DUF932 [Rhizobium azibense]